MDVSKNSGTPKSSNLIGTSIINHPFWGTHIFGNTHMGLYIVELIGPYEYYNFSNLMEELAGNSKGRFVNCIRRFQVIKLFDITHHLLNVVYMCSDTMACIYQMIQYFPELYCAGFGLQRICLQNHSQLWSHWFKGHFFTSKYWLLLVQHAHPSISQQITSATPISHVVSQSATAEAFPNSSANVRRSLRRRMLSFSVNLCGEGILTMVLRARMEITMYRLA